MLSITKVIGLMSCGFLLCLGLSNAAPAVAGDGTHERQPGGPRVGGQAGQSELGQPDKAGQSNMREGGQAGSKKMGIQLDDQSNMREGGQAGKR
jgi:hypothetical protein